MRADVRAGLAAIAGAAIAFAPAPMSAQVPGAGPEVRDTMASLYGALQELLPLSVSASAFADPKRAERAREALQTLARGAGDLVEHAPGEPRGARYLARALQADVREALELRESGERERARSLVRQTTEFCVTCHAQLPGEADAAIARGFADAAALAELSTLERAQLRVATRQFDAALEDYESVLRSLEVAPAMLLGAITSYLEVSLRVRGDPARAQRGLAAFAARPDLWRQLRTDVQTWIDALARLEGYGEQAPDLADARRLLAEAEQLTREPAGGRRGLVHYVVASGVLRRYLTAHPEPAVDSAEAYWLLGLCEYRVGQEYWISRSDFFLETAIRMAPQEPFALEAFALLEEQAILAYSDSGFTQLPAAAAQRLAELRDFLHLPGARL